MDLSDSVKLSGPAHHPNRTSQHYAVPETDEALNCMNVRPTSKVDVASVFIGGRGLPSIAEGFVAMNVTVTTTVTSTIIQEPSPVYFAITMLGPILGAIAGYGGVLLSNHLAKKGRLSEGIYQPLLGQIGLIRKQLEQGEDPDLAGIEKIMQGGYYFKIDDKDRNKIENLHNSIAVYKSVYLHAKGRGERIIRDEVEKFALGKGEDPHKYFSISGHEIVTYRAFIGERCVDSVGLLVSLIMGLDPFGILSERTLYRERNIDCIVGGQSVDRQVASSISDSALERAREDTNFRWLWGQREGMIASFIQSLEDMLRKEI